MLVNYINIITLVVKINTFILIVDVSTSTSVHRHVILYRLKCKKLNGFVIKVRLFQYAHILPKFCYLDEKVIKAYPENNSIFCAIHKACRKIKES